MLAVRYLPHRAPRAGRSSCQARPFSRIVGLQLQEGRRASSSSSTESQAVRQAVLHTLVYIMASADLLARSLCRADLHRRQRRRQRH